MTKFMTYFCLQVKWKESKVKFDDRFDKYLDPNFFQHRVRVNLKSRMSSLFFG